MHEDKCFHQIKISKELQDDFDRKAKLRRTLKAKAEGRTFPRKGTDYGKAIDDNR